MAKFNHKDMYVLGRLKGERSGKPLINLVLESPLRPDELLASLQQLERKGIISINGPKNLSDLEELVVDVPKTAEAGAATPAFNSKVFIKGDPEERADYFFTLVRLTLRGRASAYFAKPEKPESDAPTPPAP
jgi:hypothetical protein